MPNLEANRRGFIIWDSTGHSGAHEARNASSGTPKDSHTDAVTGAMQYFESSGRGGGTFRYTRTFLHFLTPGIGNIIPTSNVTLTVNGTGNADSNIVAIKHDAGSGEGDEIIGDDFNNIFFPAAPGTETIKYSEPTSWSTGTNQITLNSLAISDINNFDHFNIALVLLADQIDDGDPLGTDGDISCGVDFSSNIFLTYSLPTFFTPLKKIKSGLLKISSGKIKI